MAAFTYKLELEDDTPADPPSFQTSVPTWRPGDAIPLGQGRTLRVVNTRPTADPDGEPVLVVQRPSAYRLPAGGSTVSSWGHCRSDWQSGERTLAQAPAMLKSRAKTA